MTTHRISSLLLLLFAISPLQAQEISKEDRKVQIFTYEEKANLQNWFHEEIKRMGLTEEQAAQYNSILVYYVAKIARLDDKDKDYTKEEFKVELSKLLEKQDAELKEILSPQQFEIHKEIYGEFLRSASKRWGIDE